MARVFKWIGIFCVCVFGLGIVGAMMGGGDSTSSTQNNSSAGTVLGVQETTAASSEAVAVEGVVHTVGEVIELNGKQLTVTNVQRGFSANEYSTPKPGKDLIKVTVNLKNNSDAKVSFSSYEFKVQDSTGMIQNISSESYMLPDLLQTAELAKGGQTTGSMVFEVPAGDTETVLIYTAGFWSGKEIKVKI